MSMSIAFQFTSFSKIKNKTIVLFLKSKRYVLQNQVWVSIKTFVKLSRGAIDQDSNSNLYLITYSYYKYQQYYKYVIKIWVASES